jgi:hypothetical protein
VKNQRFLARIAAMLGFGSSGSTPDVHSTGGTASGDAQNATPYFAPPEKTPDQNFSGALTEAERLWKALELEPEASDGSMGLTDSVLALMASNKSPWSDKAGVLSLAKLRIVMANHGLTLQDLPADAWVDYCMEDAINLTVLVDAASEHRAQRGAKEAIDRVAAAIVKENKK